MTTLLSGGTSTHGCATAALGSFSSPGNHDLTFSENAYPIIDITGSGGGSGTYTITFPTPSSEVYSYPRDVANSTNLALRLTIGSGAFVDINPGEKFHVVVRPGGVYRFS